MPCCITPEGKVSVTQRKGQGYGVPEMTGEAKVLAAAKRHAHGLGLMGLRLSFLPGVSVGWPDLLILFPGGVVLFMECKAAGKRPTPIQSHIMGKLNELGFATAVCDSADSARSTITSRMEAAAVHGAGRRMVDDPSQRGPAS